MTQVVSLREALGVDGDYIDYCREERNFAAVLYHLLLDRTRLQRFLALLEIRDVDVAKVGVYFEYAHLRDLWAEVAAVEKKDLVARNTRHRDAILSMLGFPGLDLPTEPEAFNRFFIGPPPRAASADYIHMPSRWNDAQFSRWVAFAEERFAGRGDDFAKRVCTLKWAFNAKPDVVLHLGGNRAVCIEAKLESGIGGYRAGNDDSKGCFRLSQTKLQEFIFQEVLRYETTFVIISKKASKSTHSPWQRHGWKQVFDTLIDGRSLDGESAMVSAFHDRLVQPA